MTRAGCLGHTGDHWSAIARLQHPKPTTGDEFGWSLAADGATLVAGAPRVVESGNDVGAAVVIEGFGP